MSAGFKFISKMLDTKHAHAFEQYGIEKYKLPTPEEREVFQYVKDFVEQNGTTPSPEEVAAQIEGFVYIPNVTASFDYLTDKINNEFAKLELTRIIQGKVAPDDEYEKKTNLASLINEKDGLDIVDWLEHQIELVKKKSNHVDKIGNDIKTDWDWFLEEYERRKEGKTFRVWPSRFPSLNEILGGGYSSGNMYTWFARSGRGKSITVLEEAIEAAMNGATVLYYSLEMPKYEVFARAYASISARKGVFTAQIDGVDYEVGFPQKEILMAKMDKEYFQGFKKFIQTIDQQMEGTIIFRCIDDEDFVRRDLKQIEADIRQVEANVVVIDPVYYLSLERNTSKTAGGDMAETSKKLRLMAGKLNVVLHVVTQAEENKEQYGEDGERQLSIPKRGEMKKSKQLLEDAALSIGLDTLDGRGIIVPSKGRTGGEGQKIEIVFLPNFGLVKELPTMQEAMEQFETQF